MQEHPPKEFPKRPEDASTIERNVESLLRSRLQREYHLFAWLGFRIGVENNHVTFWPSFLY